MSHIRSKRKMSGKSLVRLIFSIILVFIFMSAIFSLSNTFKNSNIFSFQKADANNINTENTWVLQSDNIFDTKDSHSIYVTTVDNDEDRNKGLSGKEKLKFYEHNGKIITEGMLFVFEKEGIQTFWMKDMNFDIDMIWLDSNFKIVHIEKDAKASSYNKSNPDASKIFTNSEKLAKYVLEINADMSKKLNLNIGDILKMQ